MKTKKLKVGQHYIVYSMKHGGNGEFDLTKARRIFKGMEKRFNSIKCFVFTTRVNKDVTMKKEGNYFIYTGKRIPAREISIPEYNLIKVEPC